MTKKEFNPHRFIDREFEQEIFEDLLQFKDKARILSIRDKGGMGKSHLLERFQYRCRTVKPRTAISLISLDQLPDNTPLSLTKIIFKQLSSFGINFPTFTKYEQARISADFSYIYSNINLNNTNFQDATDIKISSLMANVNNTESLNIYSSQLKLTNEQEEMAQETCVKAFFDDLRKHCTRQTTVIMLDAYERCSDTLKQWISEYLLEEYFFNTKQDNNRILLVIAGRDVPKFDHLWAVQDCELIVRSVNQLGKWERKHVEECLKIHEYRYNQKDIDSFYRLIEVGIPPSQIVQLIQTAVDNNREM